MQGCGGCLKPSVCRISPAQEASGSVEGAIGAMAICCGAANVMADFIVADQFRPTGPTRRTVPQHSIQTTRMAEAAADLIHLVGYEDGTVAPGAGNHRPFLPRHFF